MMRRFAAIAALLCCTSTLAQTVTPAIGRLFSTPAERLRMDIARGTAPAPPPAPAPVQSVVPPQPVTVNGFVQRNGGKSTVWINQEPQRGARISGPGKQARVAVTLPSGQRILLKPGQSVDANAGTVTDVDTP